DGNAAAGCRPRFPQQTGPRGRRRVPSGTGVAGFPDEAPEAAAAAERAQARPLAGLAPQHAVRVPRELPFSVRGRADSGVGPAEVLGSRLGCGTTMNANTKTSLLMALTVF